MPIPGTKTPKYLLDNTAAGDVQLSEKDLTDLDTLPAPEGGRVWRPERPLPDRTFRGCAVV